MERLGAHEDTSSIGKVGMCMSIRRVMGMLRLAMSCSRLFHHKLTCSQLPGTCLSLGEIVDSDVENRFEEKPGFLAQPSLLGAGPRVRIQAKSPGKYSKC